MFYKMELLMGVVLALAAAGQTKVDLGAQGRKADFSGFGATKPFQVGTTLPSWCTTGQAFFKSDEQPGKNLYLCTATDTWRKVSSGDLPVPLSANQLLGTAADGASLEFKSVASGLVLSGTLLRVDDAIIPFYWTGAGAPVSTCRAGSDIYTDLNTGGRYHCSSGNVWLKQLAGPASAADGQLLLSDGVTGKDLKTFTGSGLLRASSGVVSTATAGVDYYAPGVQIAAADLPLPATTSIGGVRAKACAAGDFVSGIGADGIPVCGTPAGFVLFASATAGATPQASTHYLAPGATGSIAEELALPIPTGSTATAIHVTLATALGSGQSVALTLRKNGTDTSLGCTIDLSGNLQSCSGAGSVAFNAGDRVGWRIATTAASGSVFPSVSTLFR
jgi:hypothetical protein